MALYVVRGYSMRIRVNITKSIHVSQILWKNLSKSSIKNTQTAIKSSKINEKAFLIGNACTP